MKVFSGVKNIYERMNGGKIINEKKVFIINKFIYF